MVEPGCIIPNDLDVYVPRGGMGRAANFLSKYTDYVKVADGDLGFEQEDPEYTSGPFGTGVKSVAFYRHPTARTIVNIIETEDIVVTTAIFKFHTTFVMNYVTWNALVCAYPKMTADRVGLVNTHLLDLSSQLVRCLIKYAMRGFRALDRSYDWKKEDHDCSRNGYCSRTSRFVGDEYTMRFTFIDGFGVEPEVIDDRVSWRLNTRYTCTVKRCYRPMRGFVETGDNDALVS
ncbi:hypothetical protein H1R20_g3133, partial [Candolleomyces eurysporus]